MKNLFDYATKELSQDAFLRWLFESYEESVVGEIANRLLGEFCHFCEGERVQSLETNAQWCKIDISIWLSTTLGRKIALFIEDKTFSNEHSQLTAYDDYIDKIKEREIYKIFYKTDLIDDEERNRIIKANEINAAKWSIFDIKDIYSFFNQFSNADNTIIYQYAEHIKNIYKSTTNTQKPKSSKDNVDWIAWKSYFNNVVIPALEINGSEYQCVVRKAGHYPYVVLDIYKLGCGEQNIPYLEIRSRDCQNDEFKARILCYGMDEKAISQQNILIENIKTNPELECKYVRTHKKETENYFPKQVGVSRDGLIAATDKEFIDLIKNHIELYSQVMRDWK